ncbi:MAG: zinc ribbon domain-containing protein [Candidatus Omnitrophota bacterium]|nr:zinc ribbon domain-containing protein [Candidatus Omnitrophota bacterium]
MPTYEYECTKCGYRFDAFQNMNDAHLKSCPKCKNGLKRLIGSGSGIIFKGKGFYATDYRKGSNKEDKKEITCPKIKEGCRGCS